MAPHDKHSRAVALKAGDTVLVHATAFKGWHKIQNRRETREYVVQWLPYPNLPVYVVCPRDGEGHSQILHRNYLLSISNNLGQAEDENSVEGVGPKDEPTPAPQAYRELLSDGLNKSQLESLPNLPLNQHESVNPELTGLAAPDLASEGSQAGQGHPATLRWRTFMKRNQLPWRYQNFTLQWNNTTCSTFNMWDDLHTCLHCMVGLYSAFGRVQCEDTLLEPS